MSKGNALLYALLLSVVAVGGAVIGFDVYVSDDSGSKFTIQEATAQKQYPPDPIGRLPPSTALPVWTPSDPAAPFNQPADMRNVNVVFNVIIPYLGSWLHEDVTPYFADPSIAFRYVTLILNAGYDATAPYHPTAVGVYSNIDNRPAAEYADDQNINTAIMHAVYRLALEFDPDKKDRWDQMMTSIGLDPNDARGLGLDCSQANHDLSDPVIIGNFAGKCVLEGRQHDGFNYLGSYAPSGSYPIIPDTTGYKTVNTASELVDPSRWQPLVTRNGEQQFVTPQWANTQPYTVGLDPRSIRADAPTSSNYANMQAYKAQADEVLNAVADLTQRQKMIAEFFDNKAREVLFFPPVEVNDRTLRTADFFRLDFMLHIAQFDAGIVAWQEKARFDAVRPITAIQYLYADDQVRTFDGGTVQGSQWTPYVDTGDHPEYPSATACFCAAQAEAWKQFYGGSDDIPTVTIGGQTVPGYVGALPAGSSVYEPGMPAQPVQLSYAKWSEYVKDCGDSRVWGGLHFRSAVDESIEICTDIGSKAYDYFEALLAGTATSPLPPATQLSYDPLRISELRVCR